MEAYSARCVMLCSFQSGSLVGWLKVVVIVGSVSKAIVGGVPLCCSKLCCPSCGAYKILRFSYYYRNQDISRRDYCHRMHGMWKKLITMPLPRFRAEFGQGGSRGNCSGAHANLFSGTRCESLVMLCRGEHGAGYWCWEFVSGYAIEGRRRDGLSSLSSTKTTHFNRYKRIKQRTFQMVTNN